MNFATATHIGYVREENQDCVVLALVCDGMGGERSGKEASTRATEIFLECMEERCQEPMQTYEIRNAMMAAVSAANSVIYTAAKLNYQNFGMGTTCVAAFWNQEGVTIVNVGDSRAYYYADGVLPYTDGMKILLCSDGLHGFCTEEEMQEILKQEKPAQKLADELLQLALEKGGRDNIAIAIITD